jgi:DNA-binding ferritin-like protein
MGLVWRDVGASFTQAALPDGSRLSLDVLREDQVRLLWANDAAQRWEFIDPDGDIGKSDRGHVFSSTDAAKEAAELFYERRYPLHAITTVKENGKRRRNPRRVKAKKNPMLKWRRNAGSFSLFRAYCPDDSWLDVVDEAPSSHQARWSVCRLGARGGAYYVDREGNRVAAPVHFAEPEDAKAAAERHAEQLWPLQAIVSAAKPPQTRRNPLPTDTVKYQEILAHLLALRFVYHNTHWTSGGPNFYGDHRLLQRLYEGKDGGSSITEQIDGLGERIVSHFGSTGVNPAVLNRWTSSVLDDVSGLPPLQGLLQMENNLQAAIRRAWRANQESGEHMSLGLDNFLAGLADARDGARYLLGRRLERA